MTAAASHSFPVVASDLTIEYPAHGPSSAHVAVRGFSLRLALGEVVGLLGASGSGKSTLARVLAGDHVGARDGDRRSGAGRPVITGGEAVVSGYALRRLSRRRATRLAFDVGYLRQDASERLASDQTVEEIVGAPILARDRHYGGRELQGRVVTMTDAVRLPLRVLGAYPYELSAGQRQRVALAQAIVLGPRLLIADEPLSGIDIGVRDAVTDLIGELQRESAFSAIVISHDLPVLRHIADRIVVLHQGSVVGLGAIDDVLEDPWHPYVSHLADALDTDLGR